MKRTTIAVICAGMLLGASLPAAAILPGNISGPWYNPAQSGHGLTINVVSPDHAVAIWHVYDTVGNPLTLYIDGHVSGRRIEGSAYAPSGMRFGSFDRADIDLPHWGDVDIVFDDCNNATLTWNADSVDYGNGEMPLLRLAGLDGVSCTLPPVNSIASGIYEASSGGLEFRAIVDREGMLWARDNQTILGPFAVGVNFSSIMVAAPTSVGAATVAADVQAYNAAWAGNASNAEGPVLASAEWSSANESITISWANNHPRPTNYPNSIRFEPVASSALVAPITTDQLAGSYQLLLDADFVGPLPYSVLITTEGHLCVLDPQATDGQDCLVEGTLRTTDGEAGIIDFVLTDPRDASPPYRGRGWLESVNTGTGPTRQLNLVGHNGNGGMSMTATR